MATGAARPVVAAVNVSIDDPTVIRLAADEAAERGAPLRLVYVRHGPEPGAGGCSLGDALRLAGKRRPGLAVTTSSSPFEPADTLVGAARTASLVVVGQRCADGVRATLPVEVAARAASQVLVTPPGGDTVAGGPVVVGVKSRDRDAAAVASGLRRAARQGVPARVVHVWVNIPDMEYASVDPYVYDLTEAGRDADRLIEAAIGGWDERYPQVSVERVPLYRLDVADALIDVSTRARVLILGPPRRGRPGGAALGPVARALIGGAACPVVISQEVPGPTVPEQAAARRVQSVLEMLRI
jgi:nucleotide-binding universal stress UspA family protein